MSNIIIRSGKIYYVVYDHTTNTYDVLDRGMTEILASSDTERNAIANFDFNCGRG